AYLQALCATIPSIKMNRYTRRHTAPIALLLVAGALACTKRGDAVDGTAIYAAVLKESIASLDAEHRGAILLGERTSTEWSSRNGDLTCNHISPSNCQIWILTRGGISWSVIVRRVGCRTCPTHYPQPPYSTQTSRPHWILRL